MPKVILFDPTLWFGSENFKFNIGLLSIGSFLKHHNIDTIVYYKTKDYINDLEKIIINEVKLVGISAMTAQYRNAVSLAERIKKIRPDLKIVIGGWHVKLFPERVLKEEVFDIAIKGDGEVPVLEIYQAIINNSSLKNVKGIGFKENGKIIWTKPQKETDLTKLPKMDYSLIQGLVPAKWYDGQDMLFVYSGTGCPYKCTFCANSLFCTKLRFRKISDVVDEIETVIKKYGVTHIYPTDEFFCANKERLIQFLDLVEKRNLKFTWFIQNRIDTIDGKRLTTDILKRMRKCGCTAMLLGAESGSDKMLERMNKKIKVFQTIKAVKNLIEADIIPWLSLMIGMPDETEEDYLSTFRLIHEAKKLSKDVSIGGPALWRPIPGSVMHQRAMSYCSEGQKREFFNQEDFISPDLPDSLQMKFSNYPWVKNPKTAFDILTCVERFYNSPSIKRAIINSGKALFLHFCPDFLLSKFPAGREFLLKKNMNPEEFNPYFYPGYLLSFILYLFPWARKHLVSKNINPEKFNPLLWFKWKKMLKKTNNLYFAT